MPVLPYIKTDPDLLLLQAHLHSAYLPQQIFILTDTHTEKHCLPLVWDIFPGLKKEQVITIPAGETHKNETSLLYVLEKLATLKAGRDAVLINLGGGVVTDLGGFVASIYKRGIQYIHVPTSLLAQIDAAIGGKNGIDFLHYKNIIGSITEPEKVFISKKFLVTLPEKELRSGIAEAFKHGLISHKKYWEQIKKNPLADLDLLIRESLSIKSAIVTEDPFEKNIRKKLNAGHTIGHAIETWKLEAGAPLLHGEAVAAGLVIESYISFKKGLMPENVLNDISTHLISFFGKTDLEGYDLQHLVELMQQDKKNRNGVISFTLITTAGMAVIDETADEKMIEDAFIYYLQL